MPNSSNTKESARTLGINAAKGTMIYTVGNIIGSLVVLFLLIVLARLLNAYDFGVYAIAIAFYNILSGHFVFGTFMRKEIPQMSDDKKRVAELISSGYFVSLIIAFAVAVVAMLFSSFIAVNVYHDVAMAFPLEIASLLVLLYTLFNLTLATLVALGRVKKGTLMYLMYSFLQLFASAGLVILGYGVFGALIGLGIGLLIPSFIGMYWISKCINDRFVAPKKSTISHILRFSAPVLVSNLANFTPPNLAIMLLGVYATSIVVGSYNAAFRFGSFVSVILASTSFILLPAFAKAFADKNLSKKIGRIYNGSIYYSLLFLLPMLVYAVSASYPLIYLLFSSKYTLAPFYFAVIALGSAIGIISTYAGNLIVGYGDTRRFMYYQVLAVAMQIILLFALTPSFGANGVLLALFVISQILIDIIFVYALHKQFPFSQQFSQSLRLVASSAILMILLYLLTGYLHNSKISLITNLAGTVILFPPLAALLGGIKRENAEFMRDISKSFGMEWASDYLIRYTELFMPK